MHADLTLEKRDQLKQIFKTLVTAEHINEYFEPVTVFGAVHLAELTCNDVLWDPAAPRNGIVQIRIAADQNLQFKTLPEHTNKLPKLVLLQKASSDFGEPIDCIAPVRTIQAYENWTARPLVKRKSTSSASAENVATPGSKNESGGELKCNEEEPCVEPIGKDALGNEESSGNVSGDRSNQPGSTPPPDALPHDPVKIVGIEKPTPPAVPVSDPESSTDTPAPAAKRPARIRKTARVSSRTVTAEASTAQAPVHVGSSDSKTVSASSASSVDEKPNEEKSSVSGSLLQYGAVASAAILLHHVLKDAINQ